mmetsp:Transcript_28158/g.40090  ORF Transcript_28158/g.40090 Transcript_28158/m.40090 type:complete len:284 (+) Transcript_28158:39-890(+)
MINTIEICLSDIQSVIEAIKGGATSLEICSNRIEGGITPSIGFVEECVRLCKSSGHEVEVNVLVRPRAGNFLYQPTELTVIYKDVLAIKNAGAKGIVFGALTSDGSIDIDVMQEVRRLSLGMQLTFHRAFDVQKFSGHIGSVFESFSPHVLQSAVDSLIRVGCDRVLTSGCSSSALKGVINLAKIVQASKGLIKVVAAAGVNASNVNSIILGSGVHGIHAGSSVTVTVDFRTTNQSEGDCNNSTKQSNDTPSDDMFTWQCVNSDMVQDLRLKAENAWISYNCS